MKNQSRKLLEGGMEQSLKRCWNRFIAIAPNYGNLFIAGVYGVTLETCSASDAFREMRYGVFTDNAASVLLFGLFFSR